MSLRRFRDHARRMAEAQHTAECPSLTAVEPYWPPGGWAPIDADGNWVSGINPLPGGGLGWLGPKPKWERPTCDGCVTDEDRALWRRLAAEADEHLDHEETLL